MKKIFSFDAETDGLRGMQIAIGAIVELHTGERETFCARVKQPPQNQWVLENVWPQLVKSKMVVFDNNLDLLQAFAEFYKANKEDAYVIYHMGDPVEAKLMQDMYELGFIGEFDGPYPAIDVAPMLLMAGANPTSVEEYIDANNLTCVDYGTTHHPLHDAEVALVAFNHLISRRVL